MIRRPGRLANGVDAPVATDAARAHAVALADDAGLDLGLARANVARAGGDSDLFGAALASGLDAWSGAGGTGGASAVVEFAAIAGWRAGVLALRGDALARIGELRFDAARRSGVAAALGFETGVLDEFIDRQLADRYWWPGRHRVRGYVAAVGGFVGFGDAWIAPADEWRALAGAGAFALHSAQEWWRLDADVWGTRLVRLPAEPEPAPSDGEAASSSDAAGASIVLRGDSHLAWLHVRESA